MNQTLKEKLKIDLTKSYNQKNLNPPLSSALKSPSYSNSPKSFKGMHHSPRASKPI